MAIARIFNAGSNPATGGVRHTFNHPLCRASGTLFCFDFADARTLSGLSTGVLVSGNAFVNLGDLGSPNAVVGAPATNSNTLTTGSILQPTATSGGTQSLGIGAAGLYNSNFDFHLHAVITVPNDSGNAGYANGVILRLGTAANNCMISFDTGANGRLPAVRVKSVAGSSLTQAFNGITLGVAQILDVCAVGNIGYLFLNGLQIMSFAIDTIPDLSTSQMTLFGGRAGIKLHRIMMENLNIAAAYESSLGRALTYDVAVADSYAVSSVETYL